MPLFSDIDKFKVTLDGGNVFDLTPDGKRLRVSGTVDFKLKKEAVMNIQLTCTGVAHAQWKYSTSRTDSYLVRDEEGNVRTKYETHSKTVKYIVNQSVIDPSEHRIFAGEIADEELDVGDHSIPFNFEFSPTADVKAFPPSWKHKYGSIEYTLIVSAVISKRLIDDKEVRKLPIIVRNLPSFDEQTYFGGVSCENRRDVCNFFHMCFCYCACCGPCTGDIWAKATIPRTGYKPGETIEVDFELENRVGMKISVPVKIELIERLAHYGTIDEWTVENRDYWGFKQHQTKEEERVIAKTKGRFKSVMHAVGKKESLKLGIKVRENDPGTSNGVNTTRNYILRVTVGKVLERGIKILIGLPPQPKPQTTDGPFRPRETIVQATVLAVQEGENMALAIEGEVIVH